MSSALKIKLTKNWIGTASLKLTKYQGNYIFKSMRADCIFGLSIFFKML